MATRCHYQGGSLVSVWEGSPGLMFRGSWGQGVPRSHVWGEVQCIMGRVHMRSPLPSDNFFGRQWIFDTSEYFSTLSIFFNLTNRMIALGWTTPNCIGKALISLMAAINGLNYFGGIWYHLFPAPRIWLGTKPTRNIQNIEYTSDRIIIQFSVLLYLPQNKDFHFLHTGTFFWIKYLPFFLTPSLPPPSPTPLGALFRILAFWEKNHKHVKNISIHNNSKSYLHQTVRNILELV